MNYNPLRIFRPFFFWILIWLAVGVILVLLTDQQTLFLSLNGDWTIVGDYFFLIITYLGTPYVPILLGLFYLYKYKKYRQIPFIVLSGMTVTLMVHMLKEYYHALRPMSYEVMMGKIHMPDIADMLFFESYPSGHTACIFYTITTIVLLSPKIEKKKQLGLFIIGILVGYSRIYLAAHFFEDVLLGSAIGFVIPILFYLSYPFYKRYI